MGCKPLSNFWKTIHLLLLIFLFYTGCSESNTNAATASGDGKAKPDSAAPPPVPVRVTHVKRGDIFNAILTTATIVADRNAEIYPKITTVIERVHVEEGDYVRSGQALATLDQAEMAAALAKSEAVLNARKQEFARAETMRDNELISQEQYELKQQEYLMAQADWQTARVNFDNTVITAPFSGTITSRYVNVGKMARPNEPLFRIVDLNALLIYTYLPEVEWHRLKQGQPVVIDTDAIPDGTFQGKVIRISPTIDPDNGTFKVTVGVDNTGNRLKPGMFVRVRIMTDIHKDTLIIPKISVLNDNEVFTIRNDTLATKVALDLGLTDADFVELTGGLQEGDRIIVAGHRSIKDSTRVTIVKD